MSILQNGFGASGDYEIGKSLRFRASASAFLSRTPGVAGNRRTWTWSGWVKRGALGVAMPIFGNNTSAGSGIGFGFGFTGDLNSFSYTINNVGNFTTGEIFRDPSAFYHVFVSLDTTQAVQANRLVACINGRQLAFGSHGVVLNGQYDVNNTSVHLHGQLQGFATQFDGYLSEVHFIDGQALTPSSFGAFDANGVWQPRRYTGTYGTNGFYLPFNDGTNLTNLCLDRSGNGNNWTATNISLTAGATYDWMDDTPTNNFAVLNAVHAGRSTLTNGNLTASGTTDLPTIIPESGTWYFERGGVGQTWTPPAAFPAGSGDYNFGQRPFSGTPTHPTLRARNLPVPAIADPRRHFETVTYTGTGASRSITGLLFQPDLVWMKSRGRAVDHALFDRVRGAQLMLESNQTGAETTESTGLTAFNSDGWTMGALDQINGTTATNSFVGWAWRANGAPVTNTAGTISSQVSANTQAGFSIVTYTGTGANATVGHGLGVAPRMVIVKQRNAISNWKVYHVGLTSAANQIELESTAAQSVNAAVWNSTAPSSSVFSIGTNAGVNTNTGTYVAYCFAEVPGFSRIGSYTGNGSTDGPFVFTNMRPRWVMIKRTDTTGNWCVHDSARSANNVMNEQLNPNLSNSESGTGGLIDFASNGFKLRGTTTDLNANGGTYIFIAFAETPFNASRAR